MNPGQANESSQLQERLAGTTAAERYLAYATLYDLLSVSFVYPSSEFYTTLQNKDYTATLTAAVNTLAEVPALRAAHTALLNAVEAILAGCPLSQLGSDYIALFDANRDLAALHPYARLYGEQSVNPAVLLKKLQAIYREHGLVLDADKGAEQADHITVELEFMALLLQRLAQTPDDPAALADVKAFRAQLAWLPRFVAMLEERGTPHPLYHPLANFLAVLYVCDVAGEAAPV